MNNMQNLEAKKIYGKGKLLRKQIMVLFTKQFSFHFSFQFEMSAKRATKDKQQQQKKNKTMNMKKKKKKQLQHSMALVNCSQMSFLCVEIVQFMPTIPNTYGKMHLSQSVIVA